MHSGDITIENITKIEGSATLKVTVADNKIKDLKFIIADYRRFYTKAVKGKPISAAASFLSRICGTCSLAHLFSSLQAIEKSQAIEPSPQTKLLRRLAYDGLMLRDHALHLYFFVLPDILGIDSILEIPDEPNNVGHQLLHDSFEIKRLGSDLSTAIVGAVVHAPYPTIGGFLKLPDPANFPGLVDRLEKIREVVLRGIKFFSESKDKLDRNSDYLSLKSIEGYDFLTGEIINSKGKTVPPEKFLEFLREVIIPYSQSSGYVFSDSYEDYLVGSLARMNLNKDKLNPRTIADLKDYLTRFPSNNTYDNNLAQAIEILHCVDDAIDILKDLKISSEKPVTFTPKAGAGVGVIEAPRGTLYHMAEVDDKGIIKNYDVIVPTSQNQINIQNDLIKYFNDNLDKEEDVLRLSAEKIIRAYDPCMSCATNFLKMDWTRS